MQHRHMEFSELHICHDLVLDQNVNDNAYSNPLIYEDLDVDHKMVMLGIGFYHNIFLHLCVQHQHYPEHNTICLSILLNVSFSVFSLINESMFMMILIQMLLELFIQTDIIVLGEIMH